MQNDVMCRRLPFKLFEKHVICMQQHWKWSKSKNCECCHHHSLFKGHNVNVNTVVLNCPKCNQCHKCQVLRMFSKCHDNFPKIWKFSENLKIFKNSENFPKIWKFSKILKNFWKSEKFLKIFRKSENFPKIWKFSENLKSFRKSEKFPKIWKVSENLKSFQKSENG